jgi:hypothetical protein
MKNFCNEKDAKKYVVKIENPNYDLHHFDKHPAEAGRVIS